MFNPKKNIDTFTTPQNIHRTTFELQIRKGTDGYVIAKCQELHVVSQGKTESDAVMDAVEFMESVLEESGKEKSFSLRLKRR